MGVARIFSGRGEYFSKMFKKISLENCEKGIILAYEILRNFEKILKRFLQKIAKNALF